MLRVNIGIIYSTIVKMFTKNNFKYVIVNCNHKELFLVFEIIPYMMTVKYLIVNCHHKE